MTDAILFASDIDDPEPWRKLIAETFPALEFRVEFGQQHFARMNEDDAHRLLAQLRVVTQTFAHEIVDRADGLDNSKAATGAGNSVSDLETECVARYVDDRAGAGIA